MQPPAMPAEGAAPWYLTAEHIEDSPSRQYFIRKYGSVERARIREQESRLTTCAFLQESGQKLRLCVRARLRRLPLCLYSRRTCAISGAAAFSARLKFLFAAAAWCSSFCCSSHRRPQLSIATAIVFYHRFYARESYEHYERFQASDHPLAPHTSRYTCTSRSSCSRRAAAATAAAAAAPATSSPSPMAGAPPGTFLRPLCAV